MVEQHPYALKNRKYPKIPKSCPNCNGVIAPQAKICKECTKMQKMEQLFEGKDKWEKFREEIINERNKKYGKYS